jgi:hypothetical protein
MSGTRSVKAHVIRQQCKPVYYALRRQTNIQQSKADGLKLGDSSTLCLIVNMRASYEMVSVTFTLRVLIISFRTTTWRREHIRAITVY